MKKRFVITGALFALFNVAVMAQEPVQRKCGTAEYAKKMAQTNPDYVANRKLIEDFTTQWVADNPQDAKSAAVITIPVVVHVVYKTNVQNISDAQVLSQIPVLNADFRRLNADASNTPSVWQGIAADAGIEFCMATVDPNGNATNGITRTLTTATSFTDDDAVKDPATGIAPWPRNKYLNIWVCNLTGGILGYTTLPGGPANYDGVVIGYKYYGTTGAVSSPFNKGRTATHEIGHWLNLEHTWGDDGGSCSGSDQVSDTPNQGAENYQCPTFPLTDNCSTTSPGVMFMNYMDYVDDGCMNMFTAGQKTRMLACLNGTRSSILTSNACGNVVPQPTTCDTLTNVLSNDTLVVYLATDNSNNPAGFISGTNTFNDNAKADVFTGIPSNMTIKGGLIGFGVAYTTNSTRKVTAAVWNTSGTAGSPGTELGSKDILINSITVGSLTPFTFTSPLSSPSSFYMGIRWTGLTSTDSIGIYTSTDRGANTAWERWSNNTWHEYTDANGWGFANGLSHVIFPVVCPFTAVDEVNVWDGVSVYPNPTDGNINVYLKLNTNDDVAIRVFNPVGQLITSQNSNNTMGGTYNFDLSSHSNGLYFVEVRAGNISRTFKVIVAH